MKMASSYSPVRFVQIPCAWHVYGKSFVCVGARPRRILHHPWKLGANAHAQCWEAMRAPLSAYHQVYEPQPVAHASLEEVRQGRLSQVCHLLARCCIRVFLQMRWHGHCLETRPPVDAYRRIAMLSRSMALGASWSSWSHRPSSGFQMMMKRVCNAGVCSDDVQSSCTNMQQQLVSQLTPLMDLERS